MYSDNSTEHSDTYLQSATSLQGLLAANGVDLGFSGHAHIYQRNLKPAGGIVTYVTGGGGAKVGADRGQGLQCDSTPTASAGPIRARKEAAAGPRPHPPPAARSSTSCKVSVNGTTVTVTPTDELGRTFDVKTYSFN